MQSTVSNITGLFVNYVDSASDQPMHKVTVLITVNIIHRFARLHFLSACCSSSQEYLQFVTEDRENVEKRI